MPHFPLPEPQPSASARWSGPAFGLELRRWVEAEVGPVRLEQFKLRAWATVVQVHAGDGLYWAKQNCAPQAFEAALVEEIGRIAPDRVVSLTAVDRERGLLLMPDHGPVLGFGHAGIEEWCEVVRQWAGLQRTLAPYVDRLAAAGVGTLLPGDAEDLVTERCAALRALPAGDPRRLSDAAAARLDAGRDALRESVDVVGALGLPVVLNHNDLHGGNVFASADGTLRFFDLGDALLTEPLAVLLNPLGILVDLLGCGPSDPRLWQVAEAFLEVWGDVAPAGELRAALPHALRLARLARHEAWLRVTPSMDAAELADWGSAATAWLAAVPDPPMLSDG